MPNIGYKNLLVLALGATLVAANAAPSDIGPFTNQNDLRNAVSSFAIPTETQYVPLDVWVFATINISYVSDEPINRSEKAKYGEGKILNVEGKLVHVTAQNDVNDHTACEEVVRGTNGKPIPSEPWVALIKRGGCNFEDKVAHVYRYNASGVIVYNDRDSINLDKMKIIDKNRDITAVFTYKWVGEDFAKVVDSDTDVTVSISEGMRGGRPLNNINRTSVLFVSISFIVLMIISLIWLVFYYVQRFRYLQTKDKQSRRLCNVAKRIISRIPTKSVKADDKEIEADCCAVCIEPYKVGDVIRMLPCKHDYHKVCIDPWLLEHRTCPMCKLDILKHYGFVFSGSQESILQLEDFDDAELEVNNPGRRNSVSPLPQIPGSSNHLSRSSSVDSDSDREIPSPTEETPSLINYTSQSTKTDICISCLAATLKKSRKSVDSALLDDSEDSDMSLPRFRHSSISLPTTLKKYKGNHSTEGCRHLQKATIIRGNVKAQLIASQKLNKQQQLQHQQQQQPSTSSYSVSCDKILTPRDTESDEDGSRLDSVIVSSEHDLENLEKRLSK